GVEGNGAIAGGEVVHEGDGHERVDASGCRHVEGRAHLHVAAREVQVNLPVTDGERDLQPDGDVRHHVVLDVVRELVATGRHLADERFDFAGRVVDQVVHGLVDGVGPEAPDQLVHPALARGQPGHQRLEIAPVLL